MADEEKKASCQAPKSALKVILGIAFLAVGAWLVWLWKWEVLTLIKGCLGMLVILAGVVFLAMAKE